MSLPANLDLLNFRCIVPLSDKSKGENAVAPNVSGKLFRSANLDSANEQTVDYLKNDLKVKTIIDLRIARHYVSRGTPAMLSTYKRVNLAQYNKEKQHGHDADQRYHVFVPMLHPYFLMGILKRLPFSMYPSIAGWLLRLVVGDRTAMKEIGQVAVNPHGIAQLYVDFLDYGYSAVKSVVTILSEPANLPAVICCQQGKDRTGVLSAIVLHILGTSADAIADDYHESQNRLAHIHDKIKMELLNEIGLDKNFAFTPRQAMLDVFTKLEQQYGSIDDYLRAAGIDQELRTKLVKACQNPASAEDFNQKIKN